MSRKTSFSWLVYLTNLLYNTPSYANKYPAIQPVKMVMSKYNIISNTDFALRCSKARTSETLSSSLRVNLFPVQHPALLLAAKPPPEKPKNRCTDTSQHKALPSLLSPGVLRCLKEAALLSSGLEPDSNRAQRKGHFHSSSSISKREAI